ncbi:MFS transporter [Actinocorallia sp. A-T 12471]|uniref:MFS transporter n=1 Tax=Actinocorallia sp. A-T 12471 TaxID=3089813 RepID=UPI0029D31FBF|nr:MFS transporter [Actinocorallia sp. A-T 12471]MDX6743992.1 MFS transporter [Actinocorallia sp. A-T 12471]
MSEPTPAATRPRAIVAVLAGAGITVSLMQTLIVPILPDLPRILHTSAANASWAITATLLAGAVATPVAGRLGDLYGKRRILLACTFLLTAGSLVCAIGASLWPVVIGRTLQGLGLPVIGLGISVMRDVLPPERLGTSMALMSSSLGVGGALGLPIASVIAEHTGWQALFWISAGAGALITALIALCVPESPLRAGGRFDVIGALGLAAGLLPLLLAISKGGDWGWTDPLTLTLFAFSLTALTIWGWWELRVPSPVVDLRATARRQVLVTNLASILIGFTMYAMSLVTPQLLQLPPATGYGLGLSMTEAGLWMAPGGLGMMAVSPFAARLSRTYGARTSLLVGALVICGGYLLALPLMAWPWGVVIFSLVISVGVGFAFAAMPALIMAAVPLSETAAANGLNSLARSLGTSTCSAVVGVVLAHMTVQVGDLTVPSAQGLRTVLVMAAAMAAAAALTVLAIPRRPHPTTEPAAPAVVTAEKQR